MTVYAIQSEDTLRVKIGHTNGCPTARRDGLQTGNDSALRLLGVAWGASRDDERALHIRFAADRVRGEWFNPSPALLAWATSLPSSVPFWTWLLAQVDREDPIGDFASDTVRCFKNYKTIPRFHRPPLESSQFDDWQRHLWKHPGAGPHATQALKDAFAEWHPYGLFADGL